MNAVSYMEVFLLQTIPFSINFTFPFLTGAAFSMVHQVLEKLLLPGHLQMSAVKVKKE